MRMIDADALADWIIAELRTTPNGVFNALSGRQAANLIGKALDEAPTVGKEFADSLDCFRRIYTPYSIVCEQTQCKWRCEGRDVGLNHGYCAANNLMGDIVRLFGGNPGYGVVLRDRVKEGEVE